MTSTQQHIQLKANQSQLPIGELEDKLASEQAHANSSKNRSEFYASLKQAALKALAKHGLPDGKTLERWKYSPLHLVWKEDYFSQFLAGQPRTDEDAAPNRGSGGSSTNLETALQVTQAITLPLCNGRCSASDIARLSEVAGLSIQYASALQKQPQQDHVEPQLTALAQADGLCATTLALAPETVVITLTDDFDTSCPLIISHGKARKFKRETENANAEATADNSSILIRLDNRQKITIIEHYTADEQHHGLKSALSLIDLGPEAHCEHLRLMSGQSQVQQHFYTRVRLAANSQYYAGNYSVGSGFIRSVTEPQLTEPGAHCQISGAYLAGNDAHHDHRIFVDHLAPNCTSQSFFKGIAGQGGTAVFNGRIHIAPGAKQSDGRLQNRNLLLDNKSTVHTKPELEIYNDDVKCSHGATVSQLDHQQLLYLQSRGLDQEAAVHLLLESYLLETLNELPQQFSESQFLRNWLVSALTASVPAANIKEITA